MNLVLARIRNLISNCQRHPKETQRPSGLAALLEPSYMNLVLAQPVSAAMMIVSNYRFLRDPGFIASGMFDKVVYANLSMK